LIGVVGESARSGNRVNSAVAIAKFVQTGTRNRPENVHENSTGHRSNARWWLNDSSLAARG
jgi:uncharacterized protein YhjY with autotransporter beta-barrel domain